MRRKILTGVIVLSLAVFFGLTFAVSSSVGNFRFLRQLGAKRQVIHEGMPIELARKDSDYWAAKTLILYTFHTAPAKVAQALRERLNAQNGWDVLSSSSFLNKVTGEGCSFVEGKPRSLPADAPVTLDKDTTCYVLVYEPVELSFFQTMRRKIGLL